MFWISNILVYAIVATLGIRISRAQHKPWPQYSLQNMPKTQFTCHDKILGGYYADPETQCQMFHICVKVAGVGVQDFRFLCPNSTAFDQEAQTCANWDDVDCNQSVLYYGSDNFDLYRLDSGYENKRAPAAEEDESVFHLQRAESGDGRRYKENRIDQKYRPDQPPNYTRHFEATARKNQTPIYNKNNNNLGLNNKKIDGTKRPIVSYYTPTSTTEPYKGDTKQDIEDIFKGSHSSNFFTNRQNGREDELLDHSVKQKPNEFADYSRKVESSANGKTRIVTTRIKRPLQITNTNDNNINSTNTKLTNVIKVTKKITPIKNKGIDINNSSVTTKNEQNNNKSWQSNANKVFFGFDDYQTQIKIQPTTYNPNRVKRPTPQYNELKRDKADATDENYQSKNFYKPTVNQIKKLQKYEDTQQKLAKPESTFDKYNVFKEFAKVKQPQQPQPFKPAPPSKTFNAPIQSDNEPQYYRSRNQNHRGFTQSPAPFSITPKSIASGEVGGEVRSRGSAGRSRVNFRASTLYDYYEAYPTASNNGKKFSTLVTKEKYTPTTFKPSTYKKFNEQNFYQTSQLHTSKPKQQQQQQTPTKVSSNISGFLPTTVNPYYNPDEDDGQYHPELYELDFPKNRLNLQRSSTTTIIPLNNSNSPTIYNKAIPSSASAAAIRTTTTTATPKPFTTFQNPAIHLKSQQQTSFLKEQSALTDLSDEDELFRGASSLNFGAASINKLRADIIKAEKTSQQYNSQYNPHNTFVTTPTVAAAKVATENQHQNHNYNINENYNQTVYSNGRDDKLYYNGNEIFSSTTTLSPRLTASTTTTTATATATQKSAKKVGKSDKLSKSSKSHKKTSKRPPHADENTSYDYAYYDTDADTLSESPKGYDEYEIAEFSKTPKFK